MDNLLRTSHAPVLILEGARAVGKTTAVRHELMERRGFSYTSLADPLVRREAARDVFGWVDRLRLPAIVDEAQLVPDLPLAVKERVDREGQALSFVLTGSASIGRAGLGGADPLTRRSQRSTLRPFTRWEQQRRQGSVVDLLFDADVHLHRLDREDDADLLERLRTGGFPGYLYPDRFLQDPGNTLRRRMRADVTALLSDSVLAEHVDAARARKVLDALLCTPGGIYTATRHAQQLEMDRRTIDRLVEVLHRLFLVHSLPNSAVAATKQSYSRSKIHAVDTALAVEALERQGTEVLSHREHFGALLESHVVNELVAAIEWSDTRPEASYWRLSKPPTPEVDLVLTAPDGRRVGVEVKASSRVDRRDARHLMFLRDHSGMHRGFVIYTGSEVVPLEDGIWALPVSALADPSPFRPREAPPERTALTSATTRGAADVDARIFLSYVHDDDARSRGRMVQFAKDVAESYAYLFGFDIELFVDRDDIEWGDVWQDRLDTELSSVPFLMSMITPRYLRSDACRREVLQFSTADPAKAARRLLSIQWIDIDDVDVVPDTDPVLLRLKAAQWIDMTDKRLLAVGSPEYDREVEETARRLRRAISAHRSSAATRDGVGTRAGQEQQQDRDERSLDEVLPSLTALSGQIETDVNALKSAFDTVGSVMNANPMPPRLAPADMSREFSELGESLAAPVARVDDATESLGQHWHLLEKDIARLVDITENGPASPMVEEVRDSLRGLDRALDMGDTALVAGQLSMLGSISRHLQPLARAVGSTLTLMTGIKSAAQAWRDRLA